MASNSVHVVVVGSSIHNPDSASGSNVGAGDLAANPISKSIGKTIVLTVSGVRFSNPA